MFLGRSALVLCSVYFSFWAVLDGVVLDSTKNSFIIWVLWCDMLSDITYLYCWKWKGFCVFIDYLDTPLNVLLTVVSCFQMSFSNARHRLVTRCWCFKYLCTLKISCNSTAVLFAKSFTLEYIFERRKSYIISKRTVTKKAMNS